MVRMEKQGVPSVAILTTAFQNQVTAFLETQEFERKNLKYVSQALYQGSQLSMTAATIFVSHPVSDQSSLQLQHKADQAYEYVVKALTSTPIKFDMTGSSLPMEESTACET